MEWYDGYRFGETEVYNPWSIINYVDTAISQSQPYPKPYWSNTFSNSIIRELVEEADSDTKEEIQMLIDGKTIEKPVHEDITYEDTIREWFEGQTRRIDFQPFYRAVLEEQSEEMEEFLSGLLEKSISYYDNREAFYHGVMVGPFGGLSGYEMKSNRECGNGRPDLELCPYNPRKPVIIFEFKSCKKFNEMSEGCQAALRQIEEKDYAAPFLDKGYTRIINYGICFCEKTCRVEQAVMLRKEM